MKHIIVVATTVLLTALSSFAFADDLVASIGQATLPGSSGPEMSVSAPESSGSKFISHLDLYWTGRLNGQALDQPLGVNYSPFARGVWPIYMYHTVDVISHFDYLNSVGVEVSATQDLVHGVKDSGGYDIEPTLTGYDPQIWFRHNALIEISFFKLDGQVSIFPAVTTYSRSFQTELFSAAFDTQWNLKLPDRSWTAYLGTRIRPTLYQQNQPPLAFPHFGEQRERMFLSMGHFVGYHITDRFEVTNSSLFDCNYSADASGPFVRGDANDDRTQVQLNYYTPRGLARLGVYLQGIVANPTLQNTTIGLDVTINFLTAR